MVKKKYEVISKGMTVFGAKFGEVIELDEEIATKFVKGKYIEPSRKQSADKVGKATPTVHSESKEQPKQVAKKQPQKENTAPKNPSPENAEKH